MIKDPRIEAAMKAGIGIGKGSAELARRIDYKDLTDDQKSWVKGITIEIGGDVPDHYAVTLRYNGKIIFRDVGGKSIDKADKFGRQASYRLAQIYCPK